MNEISDPQYPIGRFEPPVFLSADERTGALGTLAEFPRQLTLALDGLNDAHLDTPYRSGGWTIRQVVHHLADSHMNAALCVRLSLTEEWPTIYAYDPAAWAALPDNSLPVHSSLKIIEGVHQRLVATLREVKDADWSTRGYVHPETGRCPLEQVLPMYACTANITSPISFIAASVTAGRQRG